MESVTVAPASIIQHPPPRVADDAGFAYAAGHAPRRQEPVPTRLPAYRGETYYGGAAVKASPYGWKVALYMWLGGMGGAAQIIAAITDLLGQGHARTVVRHGRYLALLSAVIGPVLLVIDLHTPQRFFNMLRIFRRTSAMSIGTYVLMSFGMSSGLAALGQYRGDRGGSWRLARMAQLPAALAGSGMASYTAALLSSTSTPLWAAAPCLLGARFAASSMATAAAALSLAEPRDSEAANARALDTLAIAAAATELAASLAADLRYEAKGVAAPLHSRPWGPAHALGVQLLGLATPLAFYALSRRRPQRRLPVAAALGILAGGLLMRATVLHAGNRSAERPRDYFTLAQPGVIPENRDAVSRALEAPRP